MWANMDGHTNGDEMGGRRNNANNRWHIAQGESADDVEFLYRAAGSSRAGTTTSNLMTIGTWLHVMWVYDGSLSGVDRMAIYIDGATQPLTYSGTGSFPATFASYGAIP